MSQAGSGALPRLLGIVDADLCARTGQDPEALARILIGAGLPFLWLRCRTLAPADHLALARAVALLAQQGGVAMVVSDRADIARAVGCGVHIPSNGLPIAACREVLEPGVRIGVSAHGQSEIAGAAAADYATLSPVREPLSKPGYAPSLELTALRALAREAPVPVFALGGVSETDADLIPDFHGLALMGPLHGLTSSPPAEVVRTCLAAVAARVAEAGLPS